MEGTAKFSSGVTSKIKAKVSFQDSARNVPHGMSKMFSKSKAQQLQTPDIELETQNKADYFQRERVVENVSTCANSPSENVADRVSILPEFPGAVHDGGDEADAVVEEPEPDVTDKKLKFNTPRNKWRVFSTFFWFFSIGWTDATAGAILADIEAYYGISYAVVSLIWLGNALGFITIAVIGHKLINRLGFHKTVALSPASYAIMGAIVTSGTKFPAIVIAYYIGGLGGAIGLAQFNVHLSRFDVGPTLIGCGHGSYGVGAMLAPIVSTVMVDHGISWHYFYAFLLVFASITTVTIWMSYNGINSDLREFDQVVKEEPLHISESLHDLNTWLICFFILFYQGAEVGLAGYIVSYLLDYRSGDKGTVGYVASGFWAGLTLGRFLLTTISLKKMGARLSVILFTTFSIILILLSWFIPNLIAESVLIAIAGVFIGPMYPMLVTSASRILPRKIVVVSLSLASAFGSTGGSLFPFLVGLISQFKGSFIVLPFSVALFVAMVVCWIILPNMDRPHVKNWRQRIV